MSAPFPLHPGKGWLSSGTGGQKDVDVTVGHVLIPLTASASTPSVEQSLTMDFLCSKGRPPRNNNVCVTTGLVLSQPELPDFIPNVHRMLATLLSFCF